MAQEKKYVKKSASRISRDLRYSLNYYAEEFINISTVSSQETGLTAMDIYENSEKIFVEIELAGVDPNDISVTLSDGSLVIEGSKYEPTARQPGLNFHCAERSFGAFRRTFVLGSAIDSQQIEAAYHNGILKLQIPKVRERRSVSHLIKVKVDE